MCIFFSFWIFFFFVNKIGIELNFELYSSINLSHVVTFFNNTFNNDLNNTHIDINYSLAELLLLPWSPLRPRSLRHGSSSPSIGGQRPSDADVAQGL